MAVVSAAWRHLAATMTGLLSSCSFLGLAAIMVVLSLPIVAVFPMGSSWLPSRKPFHLQNAGQREKMRERESPGADSKPDLASPLGVCPRQPEEI